MREIVQIDRNLYNGCGECIPNCHEAANRTGSTGKVGICGVTDQVINLQDLYVFTLKGLAYFQNLASENGQAEIEADRFFGRALFMTITNANFDQQVFVDQIIACLKMRDELRTRLEDSGITIGNNLHESFTWEETKLEEFLAKAQIPENKIDAPIVAKVLVETFGIGGITQVKNDIEILINN